MSGLEIIEKLCEEKHITMPKLETLAECGRGTITDFKYGRKKKISFALAKKLTNIYPDINPTWLMSGTPPMYIDGESAITQKEKQKEELQREKNIVHDLLKQINEAEDNHFKEKKELYNQITKLQKQNEELLQVIKNLTSPRNTRLTSPQDPQAILPPSYTPHGVAETQNKVES